MAQQLDWRRAARTKSGKSKSMNEKMYGPYSRAEVRKHDRLEAMADALLGEETS